jgi:3-deoxy-D-manno-octulosonate 8-phosphate phosphatase (KDO 8-P phosphatase)
MEIKLVLSDVDGVWTDGGFYFTEEGEMMKKISVYDGWGVRYCRNLGIPVGIITAEESSMAIRAAEKFKTPYIYSGVKEKLPAAQKLCEELGISLKETAYIGDDLNDLPLLLAVGYSGCPANANKWVKERVDYVCTTKGGDGAFREFVESLLQHTKEFSDLVTSYATYGVFKPQ